MYVVYIPYRGIIQFFLHNIEIQKLRTFIGEERNFYFMSE